MRRREKKRKGEVEGRMGEWERMRRCEETDRVGRE